MSKQVPFTVHIKIFPQRPGKRTENMRELQRIASLISDSVVDAEVGTERWSSGDTINVATPSGGQSYGGSDAGPTGSVSSRFSDLSYGGAVVPQFGDAPPQVRITGFYTSSSANNQPHPDTTLVHAGQTLTRAGGAHPWETGGNPTSTIETEVKALKTFLETNITAGLPSSITYKIFRIEYSGIVWGDRGHHFPK